MFISSQDLKKYKLPNIYIAYKSEFNDNHWKSINCFKETSKLSDKEFEIFLRNIRHYYIINQSLLEDRIKIGANIELIEQEFNLPFIVLDMFCKYYYKEDITTLLSKSYASFKVQLFKDAYALAQRNPMIMRMFMEKYLDFNSEDSKEQSKDISIPQQLLNLLTNK